MGSRSFTYEAAYTLGVPILMKRMIRSFFRRTAIVFFCHRILPPPSEFSPTDAFYYRLGHPTVEEFEVQLEYLSRHHELVSLADVAASVLKEKKLPEGAVALTFDDGYRDNYDYAFPLLERYRCKAAFFLTTGFIGTGMIPFHDRIIYALCHTGAKRLEWEEDHGKGHRYPLGTLRQRIEAFLNIQQRFKQVPFRRRAGVLEDLIRRLDVGIAEDFTKNLMLDWQVVGTMASAGHSFYSHTGSHPLLSALSGDELREEIVESRRVIREKIASEGEIFCYPYGKKGEFDDRVVALLKGHGFIAACTALHGLNKPGDDPFLLKRTAMISEPLGKFALRASGLFEILKGVLVS